MECLLMSIYYVHVDLSPLILPVAPWNTNYCLHKPAFPSRLSDQMMPLASQAWWSTTGLVLQSLSCVQLLWPPGLYPKRRLCPWNFPGKFPDQRSQVWWPLNALASHFTYSLSLQLLDTPFLCLFQPHLLPSKPETAVCSSASSRLLQRKNLFFSVQLQVSSLFLHAFSLYKRWRPYTKTDWAPLLPSIKSVNTPSGSELHFLEIRRSVGFIDEQRLSHYLERFADASGEVLAVCQKRRTKQAWRICWIMGHVT